MTWMTGPYWVVAVLAIVSVVGTLSVLAWTAFTKRGEPRPRTIRINDREKRNRILLTLAPGADEHEVGKCVIAALEANAHGRGSRFAYHSLPH
jgi:hypothetical protein